MEKEIDIRDIKKYKPNITESEIDTLNFWYIRGYKQISHILGYCFQLHRAPRYAHTGIDLQYLEQFKEKAKEEARKEIYHEIRNIIYWRDGSLNCEEELELFLQKNNFSFTKSKKVLAELKKRGYD